MADPIAFVEAAYAKAADEAEWLERLARAALPLLHEGKGLLAFVYDTREPEWVNIGAVSAVGFDPTLAGGLLNAPVDRGDETRSMVRIFAACSPRPLKGAPANATDFATPVQRRALGRGALRRPHRERDGSVTAGRRLCRSRRSIAVTGARAKCTGGLSSPRTWPSVSALKRLRRQLSDAQRGGLVRSDRRPDGHLEHAETSARGARARAALRRGALALERARGPLRRGDADEALAMWEGLVAGRWSLVDHFDSDGRRYLMAHRNDPDAPDLRGLTLRERQVVGYAGAGHSNKIIAYESV